MTAPSADGGPEEYFVLQRKGQLLPAVAVAAYRLCRLPVWCRRTSVDPNPVFHALEDAVVQAALFCDERLNTALQQVLATAEELVGTVTEIQESSRPGFGGNVQEQDRVGDELARQGLDEAITAFIVAVRGDLRIAGPWTGAHP